MNAEQRARQAADGILLAEQAGENLTPAELAAHIQRAIEAAVAEERARDREAFERIAALDGAYSWSGKDAIRIARARLEESDA